MAISYQAKIDLIVAGLGQIETAEKRIKSLLRESRKLQRGGIAQRGTAALAATTRESRQQSRRQVRNAERRLELQSKLNSATDLYNRKLQQFQRAGGAGNKQLQGRVDQITQAFAVGTKEGTRNLRLTRALATELGRVVEQQRELNRARAQGNKGFEAGRRGFERISALRASGFGAERQISGAESLVRKIGPAAASGDQAAFNEAVRKAEVALRRLEREFQQAERAQRASTKAKRDVERAERRLANEAKKDARDRANRRKRRFQDIATGAGFPLLFGGGPVQALAGGIGGAFGGFGGSIAATALAGQVEAFARAAAETGVALTSTSGALELVREKSLFSKESNRELAAQLEEQGDAAGLAKLLTEELSLAIGNNGVEALQDLGNTTKETTRLWNLLTTQLFKLIAGPLNDFLKIVNNVLGGITTRGRFEGLSQDLAGNEAFQTAVKEKRKARGRNARLGALQEEDQLDLLKRAEAGEFGALPRTAVIPVTDEDKRTFTAKGKQKKDRLPSLNVELGLKERLLVLNKEIAQAVLDGDKANQVLLEKEKVREELAGQIDKIKTKGLTADVQAKEIAIARVDAAQKIQDIDTKTAQTKADQVKKGQETLDGLLAEQNLLQATLDGRKEEEEITQRVNELKKQNPTLSEEELRGILKTNAGLKEKIRLMKEAEAFAKQISTTIRDGLVDGIMAAVDGTRSLSESLSGVLKQLARMFLSQGIGSFSKDSKGGSGLLGLLPFADGGRPPVGRPSIVGERGPELFVPRSSGTIIPNHQLGGGSTNVVVNVDAKGTAAQGNDANADQLGRVIGAAVQAELIKQKRPGGLLTR